MMRPEMTAQQAEALAALLVALRPGQRDWNKHACLDALRAATTITRDTELIARAAIRAALTPTIRTPQVIPMRGAHWDAGDQLDTRGEGDKATRCHCGDVHTRITPHRTGPTTTPQQWQAYANEARAAMRGGLAKETQ